METQRAQELARAMLEVGRFSARVTEGDRGALLDPVAAHLASLPAPDDHLAVPRVSGAALILVSNGMVYDTELREHHGEVRTIGYRLADEGLAVAVDSEPADGGNGARRTVWHFRFRAGQVEIAGQTFASGGEPHDDAEAFARRLAERAGRH